MQYPRSFASDNNAGVHPEIMDAIVRANSGQYVSYGDDPFTQRALGKFKEVFGEASDTFFVFNGTAANVLSLSSAVGSYQAVICGTTSHIHTDECGAPEKFLGSKLILVPTADGKLTCSEIKKCLSGMGDQHHVQPRAVSITQSTELGTVYTLEEMKAIGALCREHSLIFHIDGARIANACASLEVGLREATRDVGADILSFGGTKNGLLAGEAVVFFNSKLAGDFKFIRKQGMQLASKMRYISAQFEALLTDDLWLRNARTANQMTRKLSEMLVEFSQVTIIYPPQANGIFATLPLPAIERLRREFYFYTVDETRGLVRWMTSFETREADLQTFVASLRRALST